MIARILWGICLLAIAFVAVGVHLDRETIKTPGLAAAVPEPFRASAQRRIAASALANGEAEAALAEAQKLVLRRPLPAEHISLLAQAQVAAGDAMQGTMTIQYAAQRGWRDPLAQEALLRLAIDAGDSDTAAQRYTALFLRRDTEDALLEELGALVFAESESEARSTLVGIVSEGDRWHNQFFNRGPRVLPPDAFAFIVSEAISRGADFDCELLERATRALEWRDENAGAQLAATVARQC